MAQEILYAIVRDRVIGDEQAEAILEIRQGRGGWYVSASGVRDFKSRGTTI